MAGASLAACIKGNFLIELKVVIQLVAPTWQARASYNVIRSVCVSRFRHCERQSFPFDMFQLKGGFGGKFDQRADQSSAEMPVRAPSSQAPTRLTFAGVHRAKLSKRAIKMYLKRGLSK